MLSTNPLSPSRLSLSITPSDIIEQDVISYILQIIAVGESNGLSDILAASSIKNEEPHRERYWMTTLIQYIPIWLVEASFLPFPPIDGAYGTEMLGCYYSAHPKNDNHPLIYLCPNRIESIANQLGIDLKLLYAKVLIHELAHAIMDPTNTMDTFGKPKAIKQVLSAGIESAMEESLANMITLQYFAAATSVFGDGDFERVKDFMKKQPEAYRFGIMQYEELKTDWRLWRKEKAKTNSNSNFWDDWIRQVVL